MSDYHVTLETIVGQGHVTYMVDQNYLNDTEVICVSRLWYSGSRNLNNVQSILFDHRDLYVVNGGRE